VSLTRRTGFSAEHRYYRDDWSPERNAAVFGRAASPDFHGHEYVCDVTVSGTVDPSSGMLMDLELLDSVLQREVRGRFHGHRINLDVPEFRDGALVPSCEVLASFLLEKIQSALGPPANVESVTVRESDTLGATATAEEGELRRTAMR
jgi:6-pyruvoyltetrahydropterin/6-carboxytetrahydropterin synthase